MGLTKQQLEALNNNSFPNNNAGYITPTILRDYNTSAIANTVNQDAYTTDSASFSSRISSITVDTGSLVTTASFNAYTSSNDSKVNSLIAATASYVTSAITASSLITASVSQSTITFTKGDGSQFNIVVADVSGSSGNFVTTASFNAYTASQDFLNTTFATTASVNSLSASIYSTDSTQSNLINGKLDTSSFTTFSTSVDSRLDLLELSGSGFATTASVNALSASIYQTDSTQSNAITNNSSSFATSISASNFNITNNSASVAVTINNLSSSIFQTDATQSNNINSLTLKTGSFATTGSNTFIGNQTINGDISASGNISASSLYATNATIINLTTIYETSSVIYSSGSNQLGDELSDIQILSGSVKVVGSLTLNGVSVSTQSVDITALNAFTASQIVSNSYFATTSSVNDLSASLYFTDTTQSNNIASNSSSIGVLQTNVNSLTSQTSSYAISSSVKVVTDSLQNQINTLATTSSVNDLSASIYSTDSTQSNNIASNSSSIGLLQTFSGSQYKNDSSSFDSRIIAAGGQSQIQDEGTILGNATSFNFIGAGVTASVSAGTASITIAGGGGSIDTGSFATTGSNTFVGTQIISGAIILSENSNLTVNNGGITKLENTWVKALITTSSVTISNGGLISTGSIIVSGSITATNNISASGNVLGANISTFATTGSNTFTGQQTISGSNLNFAVTGGISTNGIQFPNSKIYQNNFLNFEANDVGVDFVVAGTTAGTNINFRNTSTSGQIQFTAASGAVSLTSNNNTVSLSGSAVNLNGVNFNTFSSSVDSRLNAGGINTSSFATTGSNTFVGNQTITGSLTISSSATTDVLIKGRLLISGGRSNQADRAEFQLTGFNSDGSDTEQIIINGFGVINNRSGSSIYGNSQLSAAGLQLTDTMNSGSGNYGATNASIYKNTIFNDAYGNPAAANLTIAVLNSIDYSTDYELQINVDTSSISFNDFDNVNTFSYVPFMSVAPNVGDNPPPQFVRGLGVTGSAIFTELTGSLASFSSSVNSRILASTINTSSFATTGSNTFIGNQSITGSLILSSSAAVELQVMGAVEITGSVAGNITALSVASSTASIDFNLGTFFTLTIPSSSITYITGSNLKPGMTANIVLTQESTTGSVRFESTLFKFPSGSINTGSAVASAVDIVSVMSVNTTTLLSVGANRLI